MTAPPPCTLDLPTSGATARFGAWLAPQVGPGDALLLSGPIGAGKTHLARALIQKLLSGAGRVEDVPSPSFTLVQSYDAGPFEVWHADLYRLTGPGDVAELGLEDAFAAALCLVEWPDRLGPLAPAAALTLHLEPLPDDTRRLTLAATAPRWAAILAGAGHWNA